MKVKNYLLNNYAVTISSISFTQGVGVNESGAAADGSAILGMKGLLVPRMTQTQRNAISSPGIFQTDNTAAIILVQHRKHYRNRRPNY